MTKIQFFINVPHKLDFLVNLVTKDMQRQFVVLTPDSDTSRKISSAIERATSTTAHRSGVLAIIQHEETADIACDDVLINLRRHPPRLFSRFTHLIELVGRHESDKLGARHRFRFYRDHGYHLQWTMY